MCVERSEQYKDGDYNHVSLSGTMEGPAKFYYAKGTTRFDFMVRSVTSWGTIHKFLVQVRGQKAQDIFMGYMRERELDVSGRLKARAKGRVMIVADVCEVGKMPRGFNIFDLEEKTRIMQEAQEGSTTFTGAADMANVIDQEEEDDSMLFEDVMEGEEPETEEQKKAKRDEKLRGMCWRYYEEEMAKGTAAATLFNEDGTILIEEADEIVDRWYSYFDEIKAKGDDIYEEDKKTDNLIEENTGDPVVSHSHQSTLSEREDLPPYPEEDDENDGGHAVEEDLPETFSEIGERIEKANRLKAEDVESDKTFVGEEDSELYLTCKGYFKSNISKSEATQLLAEKKGISFEKAGEIIKRAFHVFANEGSDMKYEAMLSGFHEAMDGLSEV